MYNDLFKKFQIVKSGNVSVPQLIVSSDAKVGETQVESI